MKVRVKYFALFRDQAGCGAESVEWDGGTATELFQMMTRLHPDLKTEAAALLAINDEMRDWETPVNDGDEVLFFPPVAGG